MQKLTRPGRLFFAIGLMALAIMQFILDQFILSRPHPWPWQVCYGKRSNTAIVLQ
jgi:hypothetical protein